MSFFDELFTAQLQPMATSSSSATPNDGRKKLGDELAAFHARAVSHVTFTSSASSSSKAAVLGALEADRKRIERLRTGDLAGVELDRWKAIAKTTHEDIAFQTGLTNEWSLSSVVGQTVAATAKDVTDLTAKWLPWILGAAALVAVAYVAGPAIRKATR